MSTARSRKAGAHHLNSPRASRRVLAPLAVVLAALVLIAAVPVADAVSPSPAANAARRSHKRHKRRHHHKHKHHHKRVHRHPRRAPSSRFCDGENAKAIAASMQPLRGAVVCLMNQQRAAHGLPPVGESYLLDRSAQGWTDAMVASGFFSHGANFAARISAVGFAWSTAGENIATGFATPHAVVDAWMGSSDHCRNILNPTFKRVGVGANGRAVLGWAGRPATWTVDFALPAGQGAPSGNWGPASRCPY